MSARAWGRRRHKAAWYALGREGFNLFGWRYLVIGWTEQPWDLPDHNIWDDLRAAQVAARMESRRG